jgi:hypothetical protein
MFLFGSILISIAMEPFGLPTGTSLSFACCFFNDNSNERLRFELMLRTKVNFLTNKFEMRLFVDSVHVSSPGKSTHCSPGESTRCGLQWMSFDLSIDLSILLLAGVLLSQQFIADDKDE